MLKWSNQELCSYFTHSDCIHKLLNKKNDLLVLSKGQKKTGQTNTKRDGEKLQNKAMLLQKYE
jgi:hypothetical protein